MSENLQVSEYSEWKETCVDTLTLAVEHFSIFIIKSFLQKWESNVLIEETAHKLASLIILYSPCIDFIPEDADRNSIALHATSELIFHFRYLANKTSSEFFSNFSSTIFDESDIISLTTYTRLLMHYFVLKGEESSKECVKNILIGIIASQVNSLKQAGEEHRMSLIRDIWVNNASEFGEFDKIVDKRIINTQALRKSLMHISGKVLSSKLEGSGGGSIMHDILAEGKKIIEKENGTSDTVVYSDKTLLPPVVDVDIELPLPPSEIVNMKDLSQQELSNLKSAFECSEEENDYAIIFPEDFMEPIRDFFNENPEYRLPIPEIQKSPRRLQKGGLMSKRAEQSSKENKSSKEATKSTRSSYSPSFDDLTVQGRKEGISSNNRIFRNYRRTVTTPTTSQNPMIRSLVRGVTQRKTLSSDTEKPNQGTQIELNGSDVPPSSTPYVSAAARLSERIGAPQSDSDDSEKSFPSSEDLVQKKKSKRRAWSSDEYRAVLAGVKRFGEGKWRDIQLNYPALSHRSNVAVKDAYRLILRNPHLVNN